LCFQLDYTDVIPSIATVNEQYKSQQLLSIVLMGIVGARYGQEVEQTKQSNTLTKGFTVEDPEMIMKLSKSNEVLI